MTTETRAAGPAHLTLTLLAVFAVFAPAVLAPAASEAQMPIASAGSRVRISAPMLRGDPALGTIESVTTDSIFLRLDPTCGGGRCDARLVAFSHEQIGRVEVSTGTRRQTLKGLGYGTLGGFAAGAVVGAVTYRESASCWFACSLGETAMIAGVAFTLPGAIVGLVIGTAVTTDRWEVARFADRTVRVEPMIDGRHLGIRVRTGW